MSDNLKCKLCGEDLEPGTKYCGCCGAEVKTDESEAAEVASQKQGFSLDFNAQQSQSLNMSNFDPQTEENAVMAELENEKFIEKESVYQSLSTDEVLTMPENSSMRGPKKALIITAITLGILAVLACCTFIFFPQITMAVMKPQEYYIMQEKSNVKNIGEVLTESYKQSLVQYSMTGDLKFELSGTEIPAEISDLFSALQFKYDYAQNDRFDKIKSQVELLVNDESAVKVLIEELGDKMAVSFPEYSQGKYVLDNISASWMLRLMTGDENEIIAMTGVTKEKLEDMRERYIKEVLIDAFPKENAKKGKGDVDGIKCTTAEFTLDEKAINSMAAALSKQLAADKETLLSIMNNAIDYMELHGGAEMNVVDEVTSEDYDSLVKSLSENITVNESVVYKVYYNSRGKIIEREVTNSHTTLRFSTHKKNDVNTIRVALLSGDVQGAVYCTYTDKNGIYDGTMEIDEGGSQVATVKFRIDTAKKLLNTFMGDMEINLNVNNLMTMDIKSVSSGGDTLKQEINFKMDPSINDFVLKTIINSKVSASANLDDISIPSESMTDEEASDITYKIGDKLFELIAPLSENLFGSLGSVGNILDEGSDLPAENDVMPQKVTDYLTNILLNTPEDEVPVFDYDFEANPENFTDQELTYLREFISMYESNI